MATEHVKVYEEGKRGGLPVWAWLIPLLLILALLAWFLLHRRSVAETGAVAPIAATGAAAGMPNLGTVHFATGEATLTPGDQATLSQAAAYMKAHPETHLRLEGYTDATGTTPANMTLSQQRSEATAKFLEAQGIAGSRLTGEGFGPQNPAATNTTAAGEADNRRVELFQQQ